MNDLLPIAIFLGCLISTLGLVLACGWLRPRASAAQSRATRPSGTPVRNDGVAP